MPFITVKDARKLTGLPDPVIRKWLRETILYGDKRDKDRIRKKKGKWRLDLALVDKLAERDRPKVPKTEVQRAEAHGHELFGLPRLDHPLIGLLQRQLINKDEQITRIQNHMDALLERNRELNVMLHKLQQEMLSHGISFSSVGTESDHSETSKDEEPENGQEEVGDSQSLEFRAFASWLHSFRT